MGGAASVGLSRQRQNIDALVNIDSPFFSEIRYDPVIRDLAANRLSNPAFAEAYTVHFEGAGHRNPKRVDYSIRKRPMEYTDLARSILAC